MESWAKELNGAITVCDRDGTILDLNDGAARSFDDGSGKSLAGSNLFDCHGPESREKIRRLVQDEATNVYTIEKQGKKKLIYQAPWYEGGRFMGLVEVSLEIPFELPHFKRD
ncbi:MAG: PAS domain-containing protein [Acidobacteria bacterium]|nr:PAS domain-containing protein [Acidobacteriota bacterium]